ncbi:hypothetical protein ES705_21214 [subsurface metagenome]|jgi:hypothetical protein
MQLGDVKNQKSIHLLFGDNYRLEIARQYQKKVGE